MHDLKFANEIIAAVRKDPRSSGNSGAIVINVRLSPLTHVKPEGLTETFKMLADSQGLGGARLKIGVLEFEMHCRDCGFISKHSAPAFSCLKCGSSDFDIKKEKEFTIDSIDFQPAR